MAKVTFDGDTKIISVLPTAATLDLRTDLYSAWVDWVVLGDNLKYLPAMRVTGLDPMGGGKFTGDIYFLMNGWKLTIDFTLTRVNGVLLSDDFDTPYYTSALVPQYAANVSNLVNTTPSAGSLFTVNDIWDFLLTNATPGTAGDKLRQALTTGNFLALK
jgi:hypothetical protein